MQPPAFAVVGVEPVLTFAVLSPPAVAGQAPAGAADFGPQLFDLTGPLASVGDACEPIPPALVPGNVALIERGFCNFTVKVKVAQLAGYGGAVIFDNIEMPGVPGMGGADATIVIPSARISRSKGLELRDAGVTVTVRLLSELRDVQAPVVSITSPTVGQTLLGGSIATLSWSATDNVAVVSQDVQFAVDGTTFSTTFATGLSGTAGTFVFRVPAVSTTTAAVRVVARDAEGNAGSGTVGSLTIIVDEVAPTVTVTSPVSKDKVNGGSVLTVTFVSTDNVGVVSHEIQFSTDDGATFASLATGIPGTAQAFDVTVPNAKENDAVIRVIARDASGNTGSGVSASFKVKK